ncbi:hypothetical protein OEZ86_009763 [Tetradesmus obliquus]|nr:hypothetical protein OEZ86_009763 [Tetradesmus obliquus]
MTHRSAQQQASPVLQAVRSGDKAKQQLEAVKDKAPAPRANLVSSIRSFVPAVVKEAAPPAAGKVKVKVKAIEAAQAARQAEEAKQQERLARQQAKEQQQQQQAKPKSAALKPQGTPSGAVAQFKVAAVERAATGLSGSGGAVRVPAGKQPGEQEQPLRPADREAAQKKAEKEAEAAKRAMDKVEKEDRMKRAEQKRKDEENKRRAELAEKQRLREERAAAAAALKAGKPAAAGGMRAGGVAKVADAKTKPHTTTAAPPAAAPPAAAASDPSGFKTPAAPKAVARAAAPEAGQAAAAGSDSPSLTIKLLDPVSTGGKAAAQHPGHGHAAAGLASVGGVMGPPAPIGSKTPAAFKTPAPAVSEQEKRNVEALKSSPYVNPGSKRTPYAQQQAAAASYIISPYRDDDAETPDRSHKPIPEWARTQVLFEALKQQQATDPDSIFGARQTTCDLGDMFADVPGAGPQPQQRHKVRKLGQRTSSADWSQDRLTWQEEINYKKQCGYL